MARPKILAGLVKKLGDHLTIKCDWDLVSAAYGQNLPLEIRREILNCTYVVSPLMGLEHLSSHEVQKEMQKMTKVARSAQTKMFGSPEQPKTKKRMSPERKIDAVLKMYELRGNSTRHTGVLFQMLEHSLNATIATTELVYELLKKGECALDHGWAWEVWVTYINRLLKAHGLPHGVRNDADALGKTSSFALLIKELQKSLPFKYRRFTSSDVALSKGISRTLAKHITLGNSGQ